jgi:hypothetical protein
MLSIAAVSRAAGRCGITFAFHAQGKLLDYPGTHLFVRPLFSERSAPWLP